MKQAMAIMPLWNWILLGVAVIAFFGTLIAGFVWSRKRRPIRFASAEDHAEYERNGEGGS